MGKTKAMQQLEQLVKAKLKPFHVAETVNTIKNLHVSLCYENEANEIVVSFITKLLNTSENRSEGLKLLNAIIFKIPQQFILEHYLSWIPLCLCLNNIDVLNDIKIQLIVKIIQVCSGTQDFDKFLVNNLQKLIDACLSAQSNSNIYESTLDCIKICIEKYPSTCIPSKSKLEQSLAKYISSDQPVHIIKNVGTAFHLLQQIAGGGTNNTNQKTNWSTQFYKLCATLHKIYDDFFQDITEYVTQSDLYVTPFPISQISDGSSYNSIKQQNERALVLRNLVIFINRMLVEKYSYTKTISIPIVLNVFKRGLMVDVYDDSGDSIEETQFSILLYNHQIELLYLLRSFIACFKQNLIPFSMTISKIIVDSMQRMQKQFFYNSCKYQEAVYKTLSYWISILQNKLNSATHNKIVSMILTEITPKVDNVVLSLNKDLSKNQAPKVRRKELTKIMTNQLPTASESISKDFLKIKENKCLYALKCCITLLENVNVQLDENNFNALFKTVSGNILLIQAKKVEHPYTSSNCVVHLYKVLHAIFHQESYCVSPLIQVAIKIFITGQHLNFNKDVTMICNNSLHTLEKLCQPLCPTLSIPNVVERLSSVNHRTEEDRQLFKEILDRVSNDSPVNVITDANVDSDNPIPPKSPVLSQSVPVSQPINSNKKINILDVHIIKQSSTINEPNLENTLTTQNHSVKELDPEVIPTISNREKKIQAEKKHPSKRVTESNLEEHDEITLHMNKNDEPLTKQMRIEADDEEEELMLASFNDSIN